MFTVPSLFSPQLASCSTLRFPWLTLRPSASQGCSQKHTPHIQEIVQFKCQFPTHSGLWQSFGGWYHFDSLHKWGASPANPSLVRLTKNNSSSAIRATQSPDMSTQTWQTLMYHVCLLIIVYCILEYFSNISCPNHSSNKLGSKQLCGHEGCRRVAQGPTRNHQLHRFGRVRTLLQGAEVGPEEVRQLSQGTTQVVGVDATKPWEKPMEKHLRKRKLLRKHWLIWLVTDDFAKRPQDRFLDGCKRWN